MPRQRESHIREQLTSLISPQLIRHRARRLGVVKRRRRVDPVALVYTLVLGFGQGHTRSLAALRRSYALATGVTLAPSAFYDRFTPQLAELLRQLTETAFEKLAGGASTLGLALSSFAKVFIADGSLVRLHDALEHDYPSVWTNHTKASAKIHVVINGATRTPEQVRVAPGSRHDLNLLHADGWCRGGLLIFDLAYYQGKLFQKLIAQGASFLCRVKKDANFVITAADRADWIGQKHQKVLGTMKGKSFELGIDYVYRHVSEHDWRKRVLALRLIASWDAKRRRHHLYVTNATPAQLSAETIPGIYAMRWEVELLFRELKTQLRLDQMPSGNRAASECLVYAALLALAFGRKIHRVLAGAKDYARKLFQHAPTDRWAAVFRTAAWPLLELLLASPVERPRLERRLRRTLTRECRDPNARRLLLRARAQLGQLAM